MCGGPTHGTNHAPSGDAGRIKEWPNCQVISVLFRAVLCAQRSLNTTRFSTDKARRSPDPCKVSWIPTWSHFPPPYTRVLVQTGFGLAITVVRGAHSKAWR